MKRLIKKCSIPFILVILASCGSKQKVQVAYISEDTLRLESEKIEENILWTRELESVRLLRDISKVNSVGDNVKLEPEVLALMDSKKRSVYPILDGFGSLDTSFLSDNLRGFINKFASNVSKWSFDDVNFSSEGIHSAVLFKYDLETKWESMFRRKFPIDTTKENDDSLKVFYSWTIGEPVLVTDDDKNIISVYEVPIRFKNKTCTVDVIVYINVKDTYKINSIQIQRYLFT